MALIATGHPLSSPNATTSSAEVSTSERPGTQGTPASSTVRREVVLSPITSMASGLGPTKVAPESPTDLAKAALSERKP